MGHHPAFVPLLSGFSIFPILTWFKKKPVPRALARCSESKVCICVGTDHLRTFPKAPPHPHFFPTLKGAIFYSAFVLCNFVFWLLLLAICCSAVMPHCYHDLVCSQHPVIKCSWQGLCGRERRANLFIVHWVRGVGEQASKEALWWVQKHLWGVGGDLNIAVAVWHYRIHVRAIRNSGAKLPRHLWRSQPTKGSEGSGG